MVEEKLQQVLWKHCPPFLLWIVGTGMTWQAKLADIPLSDGYYISSEIILVFVSLVLWCSVFLTWGYYYKYSPKTYRDEVFKDVREARELAGDLMGGLHYHGPNKVERMTTTKNLLNCAKRMPTVPLKNDVSRLGGLFIDAIGENDAEKFEIARKKAISETEAFYRDTVWVLKK